MEKWGIWYIICQIELPGCGDALALIDSSVDAAIAAAGYMDLVPFL